MSMNRVNTFTMHKRDHPIRLPVIFSSSQSQVSRSWGKLQAPRITFFIIHANKKMHTWADGGTDTMSPLWSVAMHTVNCRGVGCPGDSVC